ncbi:DinB family protein [Flagellimonas meishanensis]|uniref:DinB family protein n=1 Tax=Flagellimonas meishanensis TaxID=2873264 RepID=UPI001CA6E936|nr:DinB family protein [[Muricauda] meishanensis]
MEETIALLEKLLILGYDHISGSSPFEFKKKPTHGKWSKQEILGHLIDSAINNIQRFTEIQFEHLPYYIRDYNQRELVKANDYQNSETSELVQLWMSLNGRIKSLMRQQTEKTLGYPIVLSNGTIADLRFLMQDYVTHLEHHLNQIRK